MMDISSVFFLCNFYGMFLNNLRKPEMVGMVGKNTEAPETSPACIFSSPFTQVLNKAIFCQISLAHFRLSMVSPMPALQM